METTESTAQTWAPPGLLPLLRDTFRSHNIPSLDKPFVTPQWLGRHLWRLTRNPDDYGPLPEGARRFLRTTGGQARVECVTAPGITHLDHAYLYDMRLAYAASCSNLPHGEPVREKYEGYLAFPPAWRHECGRYHISFRIPRDWQHVGIFMVPRANGRTWYYPSNPGGVYMTWAAACECALALDRGWEIQVWERVTFTPRAGAPRPLEAWRDKLLRIHDAGDEATQKAIRKIILFTIGSFHPRPRVETVTTADFPADAPPGAKINRNADGSWSTRQLVPISEKRAMFDHPEWALEIWARTRTKLLHFSRRVNGERQPATGALTLPREHVLGFITDGLVTTAPAGWIDDGRPGTFRLKDARHYTPARRAPDPTHPGELHKLFPEEELPPDEGGDEPEEV